MPLPISPDRRELMRKIAHDGRKVLTLEAKLAKVPSGTQRDALLQELRPLRQTQQARMMRIAGVVT